MFESCTYENLLRDVLENAPDDIDTRPGSIFYDAVSGILIKVAKLYTDLELIFSLTQIDTAAGEYLDVKASEYGIVRHSAVKAKYHAVFEGTVPETGERFSAAANTFQLFPKITPCISRRRNRERNTTAFTLVLRQSRLTQ